jgi:hypothetical protein
MAGWLVGYSVGWSVGWKNGRLNHRQTGKTDLATIRPLVLWFGPQPGRLENLPLGGVVAGMGG